MSTQRYSVTPHPISTLLTWVNSGEIAIPEIQRPFVWEATKVRNLLDSLYKGYPVGYLIAWRNPTIKLKDGTSSAGKRILIDGQHLPAQECPDPTLLHQWHKLCITQISIGLIFHNNGFTFDGGCE